LNPALEILDCEKGEATSSSGWAELSDMADFLVACGARQKREVLP
jgi:hypothetical protein